MKKKVKDFCNSKVGVAVVVTGGMMAAYLMGYKRGCAYSHAAHDSVIREVYAYNPEIKTLMTEAIAELKRRDGK